MITLGLENIVIFSFSFPSTSASPDHLGHGFIRDEMVGDKGTVVEPLAITRTSQGQFAPIDEQSRLAVTNRKLIELTVNLLKLDAACGSDRRLKKIALQSARLNQTDCRQKF